MCTSFYVIMYDIYKLHDRFAPSIPNENKINQADHSK